MAASLDNFKSAIFKKILLIALSIKVLRPHQGGCRDSE